MADRVKGITVQIGGDTTGLSKALSDTNKNINNTKQSLKDVERLLKLDPTNTELLAQKEKLLNQEIDQTKTKLSSLKEAETQVQEQFKKGEVSEQQYMNLKREIAATEQQLSDLEKEAEKSNVTLAKIGETADKISEGAGKVADKTRAMSAAAAGTLGAAGLASLNYEQSFAKVSTLLTDATEDWNAYKQSIIDASNDTGVAVDDLAESVYAAISAGVDEGDAIQFVTDQVKLSKGGFTDMSKAVDVVTTAINGYKLSASDATKINDLLITTQNKGKTTVDELASSMGEVIPIAASANFNLEQLSASYALMTKNGIATSQSGTMLKAMLSELSKTGSATDLALKELTGKGFAGLEAAGYNLSDVLNMLTEYAGNNSLTLKDMFSSTEAGTAALTLATNSGQDFTEMLDAMNNSAGATDEAFEKVSGTTGESFKKSFNEIKNAAVELGDTFAPVLENIANVVSVVANALSGLDSNTLTVIATILLVVASISPLASAISNVSTAISFLSGTIIPGVGSALSFLAANPIVLIIAAIVGLVAIIATCGDNIQGILSKVDNFVQNIFAIDFSKSFGSLGDVLNAWIANIKNMWDAIVTILNGIIDFIRGVFTGDWSRAWRGVQEIFGGIFKGLVAMAKAPLNTVIGVINGVITGLNTLISGLNKIKIDVPSWVPSIGGKSWGPHIGKIGKVSYLANGGALNEGSAVVGEAGPEILTVTNGRSVVQPLTGQAAGNSNLGEMIDLLSQYLPYLASRQYIQMDTGALVGATAPAMNSELGKIATREARR